MKTRANRRQFLKTTAAAGAWAASSGYFSGIAPAASDSPNEKLNIACVGCDGQAGWNIGQLESQNIFALCDVDESKLAKQAGNHARAAKYRDFRRMLDKEGERIDAVLVATPDHVHAPATAMALRMKKHVYCEKPLTHDVYEARRITELAREAGVATQMGTQIHAESNYRRVVELIQGGAIGDVSEVHVWVDRSWADGRFQPAPIPPGLDWDLWLGPAPERPYSTGVHPFYWRQFWDYGTGSLGDMGCHFIDLVHWALEVRYPSVIWAEGPPVDEVGAPSWLIAHYEYPARGSLPPLKMTWYDGGRRPELLGRLTRADGSNVEWGNGQLFVGNKGMILSDYGNHLLFPEEKFADFQRPEPTIPESIGHHREWIQACKEGSPTTCNFDYAGPLTEAVLLGTVAYRSGERLEWDPAGLRATNCPAAERFIRREYRSGWTL